MLQDPVINSPNYRNLPPVPRGIIEPPPIAVEKTHPRDLRKTQARTKKKKKRTKKQAVGSKKVTPPVKKSG